MPKPAGAPNDYNDQTTHLARQPHDVLLGWALVGGLALAVVLGFWYFPPLRFGPEPPAAAAAVRLDAPGRPLVQHEHEEGALADHFGMTRDRAK